MTKAYGLTSQLRRACSSIGANLAEGCGRNGNAELARLCSIAMGSASELEYHLLLAKDLQMVEFVQFEELKGLYDKDLSLAEIARQLKVPYCRVWRIFRREYPDVILEIHRAKKDYARDPLAQKISRLRKERISFKEIARILSISEYRVLKLYHALYLEPVPRSERVRQRRVNLDDYIGPDGQRISGSETVRLHDVEGKTFDSIAGKFRVSRRTIRKIYYHRKPDALKHRNVKQRTDDLHRPGIELSEVFSRLACGKTAAEIAAELGTSKPIILRVFHAGLKAGYRYEAKQINVSSVGSPLYNRSTQLSRRIPPSSTSIGKLVA